MAEPARARPRRNAVRTVIGWREWIGLPTLGVSHVKAKVDTGAKTSALHAFDITPFDRGDRSWVRFAIHPMQRDGTLIVACESPLVGQRVITNSGGQREERFVIETVIRLGEAEWLIELTLTNRDQMGFRMLLGRNAMHRRLIVDPSRSFLTSKRPARVARRAGSPIRDEEE